MTEKLTLLLTTCMFAFSCTSTLYVEVENPTDQDRLPEIIEIPADEIRSHLGITSEDTFVITVDNTEVPYQITNEGITIFPATLAGHKKLTYEIKSGVPSEMTTKACGSHYPDRADDIAWENDLVGFRVYGYKEDVASGYDLFTKRATDLPVIPEMYRKVFDPELNEKLNALMKENKDSADRFNCDHISFHVDHGYGADCYAVGPTLGAGIAALLDGETIKYPYCYDTFEILENGPIRFSIKLTFRPFSIGEHENVVETRVITLDVGSHFNKTEITYTNLSQPTPLVSGIVIQDNDEKAVTDIDLGYIAYPAPTINYDKQKDVDNGTIFQGSIFPKQLDEARIVYFSEEEIRGTAEGHVLAFSEYDPEEPFVYYWGFGWNHSDIPSYEEWITHVEQYAAQLRTPIKVTLK